MSTWGYHLMLDCAGCVNIDNRDKIREFTKELVKRIDMIAHGEPIIEYLLPGDSKQGYSMMQLITTSNICGHFNELEGTAYFDIFSCKWYDIEIVKECVREYFGVRNMKENFILRGI